MDNKKKIKYINEIADKFINARNHGNNGNNWWYPRPFVIAYNVKLHGASKTIEDFKEKMTKRQKEYYSDNDLYEMAGFMQSEQCDFLAQDIKQMAGVTDVWFAGRSGGWLEVAFDNDGLDFVEEDTDKEDINNYFEIAKELQKQEQAVRKMIEKRHSYYVKYLNSNDYVNDYVDGLMSDKCIAQVYKSKIEQLVDKLN